jgi:hypothetical protein
MKYLCEETYTRVLTIYLCVRYVACFVVAFYAAAVLQADDASKPLALHPANPHYFLWRGEPAVLITSGEHYGALLNLDFDYERYFDELQAKGLNHTRIFSGVYREIDDSFGITDNPLAPKVDRFICPWPRIEQPGGAEGQIKFDLSRWDPRYFDRLRDLMQQAQQRDIVVEMTLFCPFYNDALWKASPMNVANNVNGIGDCPREEVYTLKHDNMLAIHLAVAKKIVQELRDYPNLYYEICNEPYFGGVTLEWQHRIVEAIVDEEKARSQRHLISMNIANGRARVERPHPAVSILNFHYCTPPDTVAMNYHLDRVIGENETGFRGKSDLLYRTEGWDFILAGGALYNNLDYSFTPKHPQGDFTEYTSPGGGSPTLREQLSILKRFVEAFDLVTMAPKNLAKVVSEDWTVRVLAEPGEQYAIYVHAPLPQKPQQIEDHRRIDVQITLEIELPKGHYEFEWLNTKTGQFNPGAPFEHPGGMKQLRSPQFDDDIALRIVRRSIAGER